MSKNNIIVELELQLQNSPPNTKEQVDVLLQLATNYLNIDVEKAKSFIDDAMLIAINMEYKEAIGLCYQLLGVYFYSLNDFDDALQNYLKADTILASSKNWTNRIKPKTNIAMLYVRTQQYLEALKIYTEIENEIKNIETDIVHAQLYINIDAAYSYLKQPEKGIVYAKKALAVAEQLNSFFGVAISNSNIAGDLIKMKQLDEGFVYLQRSSELCENNQFEMQQLNNYMKYTEYFMLKERYDDAIIFANKAIGLSVKYKSLEHAAEMYKFLIEIYETQIDYKNALIFSKKLNAAREEIMNTEKAKSLNALLLKYETDKKEAAINELKLQQTESELTALKSQMNPHFIFNALNSIQELYTIGDKKMANEQMGNFASLTRKILDVSGKQKIELSEEIEILTMYLELESMRFEGGFSYQIHLDENIDEDYTTLPPMLIQPYIENSMKHGLLHKKGEKRIDIYFEIDEDDNLLKCTIEDNGIGRNASAEINKNRPQSHVSFSTSATEKRLQLLNHKKGNTIAVLFEDKEDENGNALGTKVIINIPL